MFIDTHTHFDIVMKKLHCNEKTCMDNLGANNVINAVQVAISLETLQWSYDFALRNRESGILFTLGIHPSSASGKKELASLDTILSRAVTDHPDLLFGIGECGLDYYRMRQEKNLQINGFIHQITLAKQYHLPLIIHIRDAMDDALEILKSQAPTGGIMHCFPGDASAARKVLDMGFYVSFAGNVTYKNAHELHDSAAYVPLDRILVETDAPFLTPVPYRGKPNRPEYVIHTYDYIAALKNIELDVLKEKVFENFKALRNPGT
ncbi:MAG: TatD family hydrolase [Spirochaetales bacterium]|nr:TatD family hydrolase [Spirochaetales bacterium]